MPTTDSSTTSNTTATTTAAADSAAILEHIKFPETLEPESIARTLGTELAGVKPGQALRTLELLDGGNTVPFI
ncbi:MAG: hypothetical protein ACXVA4_11695, partial [Ktedonobacterales bacterium]